MGGEADPKKKAPRRTRVGAGAGVGLIFGAAIGIALDNPALGIGVGLVFGAGIGAAAEAGRKKKDGDEGAS